MNDPSDDEDIAVVRAVLGGDRNAFRRLVEKYQPAVRALARRTTRAGDDLQDLVQDVFVRAYTHLSQFSGTGRFYSWLMRITWTTALNRTRRHDPEIPTDPDVLARIWRGARTTQPEQVAERSMIWQTLWEAIQSLPGHLALAVELFFVLGLPYREIAEITDVSVNTLKSHVYRARRALQGVLDRTLLEVYHEM